MTDTVSDAGDVVVDVQELVVDFETRASRRRRGTVPAVDHVSFRILRGETLGLVGESGSGKSTIGRAVLALIRPSSGRVTVNGRLLGSLRPGQLRRHRRGMQMIFQDPFGSLDPKMKIRDILSEPLRVHRLATASDTPARVADLLQLVGLDPRMAERFPAEFSGGQRQRIAIARALAVQPDLIVADEPTSALDVSVQSQIVELLGELKKTRSLTFLFISHNLGVVRLLADRVGVLYSGRLVEVLPAASLANASAHPYTRQLVMSVPSLDPEAERARLDEFGKTDRAAVDDPRSVTAGCIYRARCPFATAICAEQSPPLVEVEPGHLLACHHPQTAPVFAEEDRS